MPTTAETIIQLKELNRKRREEIIAARTTWENEVSKFVEGLRKVDPELLKDIDVNLDDLTAQKLIPAFYEDPLNYEEFKKQKDAVEELFAKYRAVQSHLIEVAAKELRLVP